MNLFQVRFIAYMAMGIVRKPDLPLIITASLLNVSSAILADKVINKHVSQKGFLKMLVVLMGLCFVLLVVSASGLTA